MSATTPDGIELENDIDATPEAVFAALTTPASFAQWFGGPAVDVPLDRLDYVAEVGRTWKATMVLPDGNTIDWTGEFLEVQPVKRFSLNLTDQPEDDARAAVVVDLTPSGTGTRLHLTQETPGFTSEQQEGLIAGWQGFLDELAAVAKS